MWKNLIIIVTRNRDLDPEIWRWISIYFVNFRNSKFRTIVQILFFFQLSWICNLDSLHCKGCSWEMQFDHREGQRMFLQAGDDSAQQSCSRHSEVSQVWNAQHSIPRSHGLAVHGEEVERWVHGTVHSEAWPGCKLSCSGQVRWTLGQVIAKHINSYGILAPPPAQNNIKSWRI